MSSEAFSDYGVPMSGLVEPVLHLANFALPEGRGDYGSGAVEVMRGGNVFIALVVVGSLARRSTLVGLINGSVGRIAVSPTAERRRIERHPPGAGNTERHAVVGAPAAQHCQATNDAEADTDPECGQRAHAQYGNGADHIHTAGHDVGRESESDPRAEPAGVRPRAVLIESHLVDLTAKVRQFGLRQPSIERCTERPDAAEHRSAKCGTCD